MASGFKAFIAKGNVIDLAVAVIIGAAFTKIVTSLTEDVIMPVLGWAIGDMDFSRYFIRLGALPAGYPGDPNSYVQLKEAGVAMIGYGAFISAAINFLILAFLVYLLVRALKKAMPDEVVTPAEAADIVLLTEIRDELRARNAG
jgi:large conductance mechanosensitive channel